MDCKKCYNNDDILSTKLYSCFSNSIFMIPNDLYDYQKENSNILKINQCKSININFKFTDVLKRNWFYNTLSILMLIGVIMLIISIWLVKL